MTVTINGTTGIAGTNGSAGTPAVQGEDTNTGVFFPAADVVGFSASGTERVRIDANGIKFNGDTAAANALDDYEEGTWTVQVFDAATGGNQSSTTGTGEYVKIGSQVTAYLTLVNISTAGLTAANVLHYTLPFASANAGTTVGSVRCAIVNFNAAAVSVCSAVGPPAARGFISETVDAGSLNNLEVSLFTSGSADLSVTLTYITT